MSTIQDGPRSPHFQPLTFEGNGDLTMLVAESANERFGISDEMSAALEHAPGGDCVCWGVPFEIGKAVILSDHPVSIEVSPARARWLVFLHTLDVCPPMVGPGGLISPSPRSGRLGGRAADYVICYADGSEARATIRRRHQIGTFTRFWGENCFEAVAHHKPYPRRGAQEQLAPGWGWTQTRISAGDEGPWVNWLWAWENSYPEKTIAGFRFEPYSGGLEAGTIVISAISAGNITAYPLRW